MWTALVLPPDLFNHPPQSVELERAFHGAYVFVRIVAPSNLIVSRLYEGAESSQVQLATASPGTGNSTQAYPVLRDGFLT